MSDSTAQPVHNGSPTGDVNPKPTPPPTGPPSADGQLPAEHPLVRTLAAQKDQIRELKEKAARLDQIEDQSKTEAQRATEAQAAAEKRATAAEARAVRREVALDHRLSKEDAALLDSITDEDSMRALAARLAPRDVERPAAGFGVDLNGRQINPTSSKDSQAREFFGI